MSLSHSSFQLHTPSRNLAAPPGVGEGVNPPLDFWDMVQAESGIDESNFKTGEFSLVPAQPPQYLGLDRGMISGYGQTFRAVLFAALEALPEVKGAANLVVVAVDKGELGMTGNTGAAIVRDILGEVYYRSAPRGQADELGFRRTLHRSSGWVTSRIGGEMNRGVVFNGRSDDALPEVQREVVDALEEANVPYQMSKQRARGRARELSVQNLEFMDVAIPIAGYGSPFEVLSIPDLEAMVRAIAAWGNREVRR